jgi:hypothetical protein
MNNAAIKTATPIKQNVRRAIVMACYLGGILMAFGWLLEQPLRWFVVIPCGFACILSMGLLLMPYVLGVSDGTDEMLDERQLQHRNKTYLDAYRILGLLVMFAALYFYIAGTSGKWWLPKSEYEMNVVFWGTMLLVITLPTALAAWSEPDPILED